MKKLPNVIVANGRMECPPHICYMEDGVIKGKIAFDVRNGEKAEMVRTLKAGLIRIIVSVYIAGMILIVLIWYFYIRPFKKLSSFAANVSKGNLDTPLNMDKHNYFGAFTESFDRMRDALPLTEGCCRL